MKNMMQISFISILTSFFCFVSCASKQKEKNICPSVVEEPVSACRAEQKCKAHNTRYGLGLGVGLGANLGVGVNRTYATDHYTSCLEKNMQEQQDQNLIKEQEQLLQPKEEL